MWVYSTGVTFYSHLTSVLFSLPICYPTPCPTSLLKESRSKNNLNVSLSTQWVCSWERETQMGNTAASLLPLSVSASCHHMWFWCLKISNIMWSSFLSRLLCLFLTEKSVQSYRKVSCVELRANMLISSMLCVFGGFRGNVAGNPKLRLTLDILGLLFSCSVVSDSWSLLGL